MDSKEMRVSLRMDSVIRDWYAEKARYYGMAMAPYMQFVLIQNYEAQQNSKAIRDLSEVGKSDDTKEIYATLQKILEHLEKDEKDEKKA